MLCLLAEERPGEVGEGPPGTLTSGNVPPVGPILGLVVTENVLERVVQWHLRRGLDPDSQGSLLKLFEMLIGQSQQPLLQHKAVLQPLLGLLGACAEPQLGCPPSLENSLVLLLNQVGGTEEQGLLSSRDLLCTSTIPSLSSYMGSDTIQGQYV
jgi:hypothetical protein